MSERRAVETMSIVAILVFIIGMFTGAACTGTARADDSMGNPANRIARSLDNIDQTLSKMERKNCK